MCNLVLLLTHTSFHTLLVTLYPPKPELDDIWEPLNGIPDLLDCLWDPLNGFPALLYGLPDRLDDPKGPWMAFQTPWLANWTPRQALWFSWLDIWTSWLVHLALQIIPWVLVLLSLLSFLFLVLAKMVSFSIISGYFTYGLALSRLNQETAFLLRLITEEEASYSLSIPRSMSSVWFIIELYLGSFFKTSWVFLTASAHPFSQCAHWYFILSVFWL